MKIFCYNCGAKIEFSAANKPKFCMSCGASLDPSKASKNAEVEKCEDDLESEEASFSGNISKLDFDFIPDSKNSIKIEDALGSGGSKNQHVEPTLESPNISKEDFQDQWRREAGSLRTNPSEQGNE